MEEAVPKQTKQSGVSSPVHLRGEHAYHGGNPVDVYDVRDGLQDIEVEEGLPRNGAVEAGLDEGGPVLLQHALGPPHVVLAYARHPGIHRLEKPLKEEPSRNRQFPHEKHFRRLNNTWRSQALPALRAECCYFFIRERLSGPTETAFTWMGVPDGKAEPTLKTKRTKPFSKNIQNGGGKKGGLRS